MSEISETKYSILKSLLIISLGLPFCMLILLVSLIICLTYGGDFFLSILALSFPVEDGSTNVAGQYGDALMTGAFFTIGMSLIGVSLILFKFMLKMYGRSFFGKIHHGQ
mgnify:FL=1